jgi:hypothetical protein
VQQHILQLSRSSSNQSSSNHLDNGPRLVNVGRFSFWFDCSAHRTTLLGKECERDAAVMSASLG